MFNKSVLNKIVLQGKIRIKDTEYFINNKNKSFSFFIVTK